MKLLLWFPRDLEITAAKKGMLFSVISVNIEGMSLLTMLVLVLCIV